MNSFVLCLSVFCSPIAPQAAPPTPVDCELADGSVSKCIWEYRTGAQPRLVISKPPLLRDGYE